MMNLPMRELPSPTMPALQTDTTLWHHGIQTFIRELDGLVASGRIAPDARNVILWTLKCAVPMVEYAESSNMTADSFTRAFP